MKLNFHHLLIIIAIIVMCGCSDKEFVPDSGPSSQVPVIIPNGDEHYLNDDSDYIFDQDKLHTFELRIPEDALSTLDKNPAAEQYVEGMLIFEGDTISPVGIRYKGSVGAWVGCLSGTNWFDPSGFKTCTKLSMKIKINWDGRAEKFFDLKKLQLHAMNNDRSQMHERLGYWLFREMGVPAPRSVHAKLTINDQYVGLFALTEQVDNRFAKYNFDDKDGNLYKEVWPLSQDGVPYNDQRYINALRTNEDENPSVDLIKTFGQKIADADSNTVQNIIEQYLDLDEIMSYIAVDRTIKHDDGPFHWYCNINGCSNHNYYWYEEPTNQKLHLIAWDLNNAFENIINNANPITPIADEWGESSNNCAPFQHLAARQWSANCDKLTASWARYTDEYELKKQQFIDGPMSVSEANQMLDQWRNQILTATQDAEGLHNDAVSISQWESALDALRGQLEFAREN